MKPVLEFIKNIFRFHKLKLLSTFVFTLVFGVLLFPFGDLSDWVTTKVAEVSGNTLYLQFEDMGLSLSPGVGLKMENVRIETASLPPLSAEEIAVAPWVLGLITARQGVSVDASGLFNGNAAVDFREDEKLNSGERLKKVAIAAHGLSLPALSDYLREGQFFSLALRGSLDLSSQFAVDPLFDQQPSGSVDLRVNGFMLPSQTFQVPFNGVLMPIQMPELKLGLTNLQAKVDQGQLEIQEFKFGGKNEPLSGQISGQLSITLQRDNFGVRPVIGPYDLRIELEFKKEFYESNRSSGIGAALGFLDQFKRSTPQGDVKYAFRAKGQMANGGVPSLSAIQ